MHPLEKASRAIIEAIKLESVVEIVKGRQMGTVGVVVMVDKLKGEFGFTPPAFTAGYIGALVMKIDGDWIFLEPMDSFKPGDIKPSNWGVSDGNGKLIESGKL